MVISHFQSFDVVRLSVLSYVELLLVLTKMSMTRSQLQLESNTLFHSQWWSQPHQSHRPIPKPHVWGVYSKPLRVIQGVQGLLV